MKEMFYLNPILHYKMWGSESDLQSSQNKLLINATMGAGPMSFLP